MKSTFAYMSSIFLPRLSLETLQSTAKRTPHWFIISKAAESQTQSSIFLP
jgi:hypothetical protein